MRYLCCPPYPSCSVHNKSKEMSMNFRERFRFRSFKMTKGGVYSLMLNNSAQLDDLRSTHLHVPRANFKPKRSRIALEVSGDFTLGSPLEASSMWNHSFSNEMIKDNLLRVFRAREDSTSAVKHSSYTKMLPPLRRKSYNSQYMQKYVSCIIKGNVRTLANKHIKSRTHLA